MPTLDVCTNQLLVKRSDVIHTRAVAVALLSVRRVRGAHNINLVWANADPFVNSATIDRQHRLSTEAFSARQKILPFSRGKEGEGGRGHGEERARESGKREAHPFGL